MIQLFSKRIEHLQLTDAQRYERIQEFKNYLLDEFNMNNYLIERYINDELKDESHLKMLKYDRIIRKYTTKFKLSKRQRRAYTLHEPVLDYK